MVPSPVSSGFNSLTGHVTDEIIIPEEDPEQSLVEKLNAAMYAANAYTMVTKIVRGHQVAYIVPESVFKDWMKRTP